MWCDGVSETKSSGHQAAVSTSHTPQSLVTNDTLLARPLTCLQHTSFDEASALVTVTENCGYSCCKSSLTSLL